MKNYIGITVYTICLLVNFSAFCLNFINQNVGWTIFYTITTLVGLYAVYDEVKELNQRDLL